MQDDHPENDRLPLANQLFDTRPLFVEAMQRFPECLEVIPFLRKPDVLVEKELAALREQSKTFPRAHQELAAVLFYIHYAIWECQKRWQKRHGGINNYVTFIRGVERWRIKANTDVCFVTFNYDTMLEHAMEQVLGTTFDDFSKYIGQKHYSLIKLHGSINWGREVDGIESASPQALISAGAETKISERFRLVKQHPMVLTGGGTGYPALSIPVENKDEFSCPPSHVTALSEIIPKVTKIIPVGWRATEMDFLGMLNARLTGLTGSPHMMVVSGDESGAEGTGKNLTGAYSGLSLRLPITNGFTGLISDSERLGTFLRESLG